MALLISNDDTRRVLPYNMDGMKDCLDALEHVYKEEGLGRATNRTKSAIHMPTSRPDEWHRLTTFAGGVRSLKVSAIRIKPDISYFHEEHGSFQESWYTKQKGTFGALVLLFSAEDGQLLAIINDGSIQSNRVGATGGLAARHMARPDAKVVGIIGSSGLARGHVLAYAHVRNVERYQVYSPNLEHREAFARWTTEMTGIPARAFDSPEKAAAGVDILSSNTNHFGPLIMADWLKPGMHVTENQSDGEMEEAAYGRCDRVVTYITGTMDHHFTTPPDHRPRTIGGTKDEYMAKLNSIPKRHSLPDVLLGRDPGRESEEEINLFRSEGAGTQFAAMAAMVYERCRDAGIGRELDPEWFLQPIRT